MLRDSGFTTVRAEGTRRLYAVDAEPLREVDEWLAGFRRFWTPRLAALETEIARGKRQRRIRSARHRESARHQERAHHQESGRNQDPVQQQEDS